MNPIEYWKPVSLAWRRMVNMLFHPFDLEKWFVMGFAAWLSGANLGGGSFNAGESHSSRDFSSHGHSASFADFWAQHGALILTTLAIVIPLIIVLGIVFAWLHARGRFIFLENTLHGRGSITEPWRRYRVHGNSLFLWNLAIGIISILIFLLITGTSFTMAWPMFSHHAQIPLGIAGILFGVLTFLIFALTFGYLGVFVYDFIIPIMMKHNLRIRAAWSIFGPLFRQRPGSFLLYGLVRYLVGLGANLAYLAACLATCCCFFFLTLIPYIGTVLLLPVFVFFRLIGIEFLRQFGDDFTLDPAPDTAPTAPEPPPAATDPLQPDPDN